MEELLDMLNIAKYGSYKSILFSLWFENLDSIMRGIFVQSEQLIFRFKY